MRHISDVECPLMPYALRRQIECPVHVYRSPWLRTLERSKEVEITIPSYSTVTSSANRGHRQWVANHAFFTRTRYVGMECIS